jgi:hypothetical protein
VPSSPRWRERFTADGENPKALKSLPTLAERACLQPVRGNGICWPKQLIAIGIGGDLIRAALKATSIPGSASMSAGPPASWVRSLRTDGRSSIRVPLLSSSWQVLWTSDRSAGTMIGLQLVDLAPSGRRWRTFLRKPARRRAPRRPSTLRTPSPWRAWTTGRCSDAACGREDRPCGQAYRQSPRLGS